MRTIELPWATWWVVIGVSRAQRRSSMVEHADSPERQRNQHLTDAIVARS
jgi:hypothetical protein